jgi:hypothetical protein
MSTSGKDWGQAQEHLAMTRGSAQNQSRLAQ